MRIVPLGTNGFFPSFGRHTTSFLVLEGDHAVLLDAGTGVSRLIEPAIGDLLRPFPELHIILSHYHLDHVIGLSYLIGVLPGVSISIYAPAPPFVDAQPRDALHTLIRQPYFSISLDDFPARPRIVPVARDRFEAGGLTVFVRGQKHQGGSIGIRVGGMVFMTDTAVDQDAVSFVRGADILLHEVWLRDEDLPATPEELAGHSFAGGVVDLAVKAGVERLMPIHLHPRRNPGQVRLLVEGMRRKGLQVILPVESETYSV